MEDVALPEEGAILHQDSELVALQDTGEEIVTVTLFPEETVSTATGSTVNGIVGSFSEQEIRTDIKTARITLLLVILDSMP